MADLQTRVTNILKSPATEWPVIAAEPSDVGKLYREYIMPLSAIGPVASFIGMTLIGVTLPFGAGHIRYSMTQGLSLMVVSYVLGLVGTFVCAVVVEWLAPKFKSSGTRVDALKLVAYASTAAWVIGIVNILPMLGILGLLGLYSVYLFYLGLPHVMKTPADQVVMYMIVSFVVIVVVYIVMGGIATAITIGSAATLIK